MSKILFVLLLFFVKRSLSNLKYYELPRFWTNTGFCPLGNASDSLLSKDEEINIRLLGALPNRGLRRVRIHWLLDLVEFSHYRDYGIAVFDFGKLDKLLDSIVESKLAVGFELMGNPSGIFKNNSMWRIWDDLIFQVGKRYVDRFGPFKIREWRFETWNEPDLISYNKLNFTLDEYFKYLNSVNFGLKAAGRNPLDEKVFSLSGPAGLFKNPERHPLCWGALQQCNSNIPKCPFDVLTFHRKGESGGASQIYFGGKQLLSQIFKKFSNLRNFSISNNEADPVSGWSTPRKFQADVRYAAKLVNTVLLHWKARLNDYEFRNLESISHDNAFLSYHPFEFNQRTLFARFQINTTRPHHSEFIIKPVFVALGLLSNLAPYASDVEVLKVSDNKIKILKTVGTMTKHPTFQAWMIVATKNTLDKYSFNVIFKNPSNSSFALLIETIEPEITDPAWVWNRYGRPSYPERKFIELMRMYEKPRIAQHTKELKDRDLKISCELKSPSVALIRVCSISVESPPQMFDLKAIFLHRKEILLTWKESFLRERCVKSYEVFHRRGNGNWSLISRNVEIPFLYFFYYPIDGLVTGEYKVRAVDIFGRFGEFSDSTLV